MRTQLITLDDILAKDYFSLLMSKQITLYIDSNDYISSNYTFPLSEFLNDNSFYYAS